MGCLQALLTGCRRALWAAAEGGTLGMHVLLPCSWSTHTAVEARIHCSSEMLGAAMSAGD